MACPLCKDKYEDDLCGLCQISMFLSELILDHFERYKRIPIYIREFLPQISFTFERDMRVKGFFRVAYKIVGFKIFYEKFKEYRTLSLPNGDLKIMDSEYTLVTKLIKLSDDILLKQGPYVKKVLEKAKIAKIEDRVTYLEPIAQRIITDVKSGISLTSRTLEHHEGEFKGILCVALALAMTDITLRDENHSQKRLPRTYWKWMRAIARYIEKYIDEEGEIPSELSWRRFFGEGTDMNIQSLQSIRTLTENILGMSGTGSYIIDSIRRKKGGKFIIKVQNPIQKFAMNTRERIREFKRERGIIRVL